MKNWKTAIILKVQLLRAHSELELPRHPTSSTSRAGHRHHRPSNELLLLLPVRSVDVLLPALLQVVPWRHHPVHVSVRNTDIPWPPVDISRGFSSWKVCRVVKKFAKKLFVPWLCWAYECNRMFNEIQVIKPRCEFLEQIFISIMTEVSINLNHSISNLIESYLDTSIRSKN